MKGSKEPSIYEIMGRREDVSGKITERRGNEEKGGGYMGISTLEQNLRS